jgi:hypothetical protein
MNLELGEMPDA